MSYDDELIIKKKKEQEQFPEETTKFTVPRWVLLGGILIACLGGLVLWQGYVYVSNLFAPDPPSSYQTTVLPEIPLEVGGIVIQQSAENVSVIVDGETVITDPNAPERIFIPEGGGTVVINGVLGNGGGSVPASGTYPLAPGANGATKSTFYSACANCTLVCTSSGNGANIYFESEVDTGQMELGAVWGWNSPLEYYGVSADHLGWYLVKMPNDTQNGFGWTTAPPDQSCTVNNNPISGAYYFDFRVRTR